MSKTEQIEAEIEARTTALVAQIAADTLHIISHRQVREAIAAAIMRAPWLSSGRHLSTLLRVGNARDELLQAERIARCMETAPLVPATASPAAQKAPRVEKKVVESDEARTARLQALYDNEQSRVSGVGASAGDGW